MSKSKDFLKRAKENTINGFFWSIGVTLGFAFVSLFAVVVLSRVKTLPVIGNFVADVVYETQVNLGKRVPTDDKISPNN